MTQPRGSDPTYRTAYRDSSDPYEDWYRTPQRAEPRQEAEASPGRPVSRDLPARRWGMMPGRFGVCVVVGSAALGGVATVVAKQDPGALLGICLIVGAVIASLAVRSRAGYLILPVPALAYLVAAFIAGMIHDHATDTNSTAYATSALQWVASGFVAMSAATVIVIVVTAARWRRKPRVDSFEDPY
jgi:hypothetical protein